MIAADARELVTMLRQQVIYIRQAEVDLFTDQFGVLASISTFLGTLGFGGLFMSTNFLERGEGSHEYCSDLKGCDQRDMGEKRMPGLEQGFYFNNEVIITLFYGLITVSIVCHFAVVFVSVYCLIFGPELAIRGAESEQKRAIKGMYEERTFALTLFWIGCALILLSGAALGWLKYPLDAAIIVTVVFFGLLLFSVYYIYYYLTPLFEYVDAEGLDCSHLQQQQEDDDDDAVADRRGPIRDFFKHLFAAAEADDRERKSDGRIVVTPQPTPLRDAPADDEAKSPFLEQRKSQSGGLVDSMRSVLSGSALAPLGRPKTTPTPSPAQDNNVEHHAPTEYAMVKNAKLTVDGVPRYGLLADGRLRIFALGDGAVVHDVDLNKWALHLDPKSHDVFVLRKIDDDESPAIHATGTDFDDTQNWIRAIVNNSHGSREKSDDFDDQGDDDDALAKTTIGPIDATNKTIDAIAKTSISVSRSFSRLANV